MGIKNPASVRARILSWRSVVLLLLILSYCAFNTPVLTMGLAIVCMCGPNQPTSNNTQTTNNNTLLVLDTANRGALDTSGQLLAGQFKFGHNGTEPVIEAETFEFSWDPEIQGLLISGHLFGLFLVPQMVNVMSGWLGNKWTLAIYGLVTAGLNFVAPAAARASVYYLLAVRVLSGLTVNAPISVATDTLAWWMPADEKLTAATSLMLGWIISGITLPLYAGYFCTISADNGWPFIFYFNGVSVILWLIVWVGFSSRKPEDHQFISEAEKVHIVTHRVGMNHANSTTEVRTPYKTILTSRSVIAFVVSALLYTWGINLILTCLPLYLTRILLFSPEEVGVIVSIMSALRLPAIIFWTAVGNWLTGHMMMSTNFARKFCFCVGQVLAAVGYFMTCFFDDQYKLVASTLVIASIFISTFGSTLGNVIPLDMAPRYAGFISALVASVGSLVSLTAPLFTTAVTANGLFEEWRIVWLTMTTVHLLAGIIFFLLGDASLQSWAVSSHESETFISWVPSLSTEALEEHTPLLK